MDAHFVSDSNTQVRRCPDDHRAVNFLQELATVVLGGQPLSLVLNQIAALAAEHVPGAEEVSITLLERERPRTVAFSGRLAAMLDERQYRDEHGPCLDAASSSTSVAVDDTSADGTYPAFARQALRAGVRNVYSVGLSAELSGGLGAVNFYGAGPPFDLQERALAERIGQYVAVAVANAAVYAGALETAEHLRTAMASRAVIEQAKGIIMAGRGCTAEAAFQVLRQESTHSNRKLREIAQDLVDSVSRSG